MWRETGRLLEAQRFLELAAQSPSQSQQAAFDMLQLGGMLPGDTVRENSSDGFGPSMSRPQL